MICPHGRKLTRKIKYGVLVYIHKDDGSFCNKLNLFNYKASDILYGFSNILGKEYVYEILEKLRIEFYENISNLTLEEIAKEFKSLKAKGVKLDPKEILFVFGKKGETICKKIGEEYFNKISSKKDKENYKKMGFYKINAKKISVHVNSTNDYIENLKEKSNLINKNLKQVLKQKW